MREILKTGKAVFLRAWTPAEKTLLLLDVLLFGVLAGWLTAPWRKLAANAVINIEEDEEEE